MAPKKPIVLTGRVLKKKQHSLPKWNVGYIISYERVNRHRRIVPLHGKGKTIGPEVEKHGSQFPKGVYQLSRGNRQKRWIRDLVFLTLACIVIVGIFLSPSFGRSNPSYAEMDEVGSKELIVGNQKALVDLSYLADGVVRVKYNQPETPKKLKVIIEKGEEKYTYDLRADGEFEPYPLQLGDGQYLLKVFANVIDNRYVNIYAASFEVKLADDKGPFLSSTSLIKFDDTSKAVKLASELTLDCKSDEEKLEAIYEYIVENVTYDHEKAKSVKPGYIPNCDVTLESGKGICFDYASLLAVMLRSVGVPTKLVMGYVAPDYVYHAWNEVFLEGKGWVRIGEFYSIYKEGEGWIRMDSTFAANSNDPAEIGEFMTKDGNYVKRFEY